MLTFAYQMAATALTERRVAGQVAIVGRDPSCDVSIPNGSLSKRHARITVDGDGFFTVEDLASANGVSIGRDHQKIASVVRLGAPARLVMGSVIVHVMAARVSDDVSPPAQQAPPAPQARPVFALMHKDGLTTPTLLPFDSNEVTIGSARPAEIVIVDPKVSERHARVVWRDGKAILVDLKSQHGTFVHDRRLNSPVVLKLNDRVAIGDHILVMLDPTKAPPPAPPDDGGHMADLAPPPLLIPDDAVRARAKVERVTLFEDRAELVRSIEVALDGSSSTVVFDDVTTLVAESHAFARVAVLEGDEAVHVDDLRVSRTVVSDVDARTREHQLLSERAAEAGRALHEARARVELFEARARDTRELLNRFVEHTSVTAGQTHLDAAWRTRFEAIVDEQRRIGALVTEARQARAEREREAADLQALLARARIVDARPRADVVVRLSGRARRARVTLSMVVPCALWRPTHDAALIARARAGEGAATSGDVTFTTHGTVWQKTGEAWDDVELTFSTARPSAGAVLPNLAPDVLRTRDKTAEEQRTVVVEHRQAAVPKHEGEGTPPGVDDGGRTRTYRAARRASIPSDGRPYAFELARFQTTATVERVAVPELSALVFTRATFVNAGAGPILAGPVNLVENGAYIGVGDVLYVGEGEQLDLSFGSDDRFRVRHERRRVVEEKLIGKDDVVFVAETTLLSLSKHTERVVVLTRFPVSEVDKLTVSPSMPFCTDGAPKLDAHGLARIAVDAAPMKEKKLSLGFQWKTSGDVRVPDPW
mgnify:CR=1 FL=1